MIGFDFVSLSCFQARDLGRRAHRAFLAQRPDGLEEVAAPILVIEDMHLAELDVAPRRVVIAPLMYDAADGAPVTVIAEL